MIMTYLWLGLGGAIGTISRFWLNGVISRQFGETFPFGTLTINVTGSFIIGLFFVLTGTEGRWLVGPAFRSFFMIGICGGYTTFSSFSLQTLNLARDGEWLYAFGNVVLSVVLCLLAVWLGFLLGASMNPKPGG
jgi:fluoride exporter